MKKQTVIGLIMLLAITTLSMLSCATMAKTNVDAFRKEVEEIWEKYTASLVNGDPELFLSIHAEDVVKMAPEAPAAVGIQALEKKIRGGLEAVSYQDFSMQRMTFGLMFMSSVH
jgi:hypothetical protein